MYLLYLLVARALLVCFWGILFCFVGLLEPLQAASASDLAPGAKLFRLPPEIRPLRYRLKLEISPERETFSGTAEIDLRMAAATGEIWLHGNLLEVRRASLRLQDGREIEASYGQTTDDGLAKITLSQQVPPQEATLRIVYEAPFDRQLRGLYLVEESGLRYAFTQFEAIDARRCFPSFDEPGFKTPFEISVVAARDDVVIGATPVSETILLPDGKKEVRFRETPPLPTYLISFAVGPLDVVAGDPVPPSSVRQRPLPLRAVAAHGKGGKLGLALETTREAILRLERYFGMGFPYEKLDILAVPDFEAGAMENVGAIMFREKFLLFRPEDASESLRRHAAGIIVHELAHQWFGNLVTMAWWDDLWLNEAFATWLAARVVHQWFPGWNADVELQDRIHSAMDEDSFDSSRKIRQEIRTSHDIDNAFDGITYSKGAAVLGMFESWMGRPAFQKGIQRYLRLHANESAAVDDLLSALAAESGKRVAAPFKSFLLQPGVPELRAKVVWNKTDAAASLRYHVERYSPVGAGLEQSFSWQFPLCVRYESGGVQRRSCGLVTGPSGELPLEGPMPAWLFPNAGGNGYFRWSLPGKQLEALATTGLEKLTSRERLSLADSLVAGFQSAAIPAGTVLRLLESLAVDANPFVATAPISLLGILHRQVVPKRLRPKLSALGQRIYRPVLKKLGPLDGPATEGNSTFRGDVVAYLAMTTQDPETRKKLASLGRLYLEGGEPHPERLERDLIPTALAVATEIEGSNLFHLLAAVLKTSNDPIVRSEIVAGLAKIRATSLAPEIRRLILDPSLRLNEASRLLWRHFHGTDDLAGAWNWLTGNVEAILPRLPGTHRGDLPFLADRFCQESEKRQARSFFEPLLHRLPGGPRNLEAALQSIDLCIALVKAQRPSAIQALETLDP